MKLKGTYTFQVKFTNVAGMSWKRRFHYDNLYLKGKSHAISGIPHLNRLCKLQNHRWNYPEEGFDQ